MKINLFITAFIMTLISPSATFANSNDQSTHSAYKGQSIGLGAGSILGGLVAGPIGIVPGALVGALMGQNIDHEDKVCNLNTTTQILQKDLRESSQKFHALEKQSQQHKNALNDAQSSIELLLAQNQELKNHALNLDVQFRIDSSEIEKQYQKHLNSLANALVSTPEIEIEVAGFADRMGDENHNMELSRQRAEKVKEFLVQQGVDEDRITTLAYGESQPLNLEENLENNFFDRRVRIKLHPTEITKDKKYDNSQLSVANN